MTLGKSAALLALGIVTLSTTNLYAAREQQSSITLPTLKPGFSFNVASIWLKPGASNLNYVIYNKGLPLQTPTWTERELQPGYSPGIELGISYVFPSAVDKNINLDWTHLYSSTSSSTAADNTNYFLGPDYEIGPVGIPIRNATGNVKFKYDVVNLDVGQFVNFGEQFQVRFFGGLSTGFLREDTTATYSGERVGGTYPGPFSMTQSVSSNFTGIGPRVGLSADYTTQSGFGFLGEAAASALIGSQAAKTSYAGYGQELLIRFGQTTTNLQTITDQHVSQVIPGFDAKLGISYKHKMSHDALFTISAGYQAAVYINAISQYLPGSLVANEGLESGSIYVATMSHTLSNYSVQGPFLNFALQC